VRRFPCRNRETAYRAVKDEGGLVVLPDQSVVKVLNPVGSKIYSMLDGTNSVDQIVDAIVEDFEVDRERAAKDVEAFLDELEAEGMLAMEEPEGSVTT